MTVFSKRNALIGWATWVVGKKILRRDPGHGRRNKAAATAAVLATVAGAVLFWRKKHHEAGPPADVVGEPS